MSACVCVWNWKRSVEAGPYSPSSDIVSIPTPTLSWKLKKTHRRLQHRQSLHDRAKPSRCVLLEAFCPSSACDCRNRAHVRVRGAEVRIGGGVHAEMPPDEEGKHLERFCPQDFISERAGGRREIKVDSPLNTASLTLAPLSHLLSSASTMPLDSSSLPFWSLRPTARSPGLMFRWECESASSSASKSARCLRVAARSSAVAKSASRASPTVGIVTREVSGHGEQ